MDVAIDWLDRAGQTSPLRTTPARWLNPRFSGDGRRLAFDLFDGSQHDIWIDDWTTDGMTRLTFRGNASVPVWTPDSRRITFDSTRGPPKGIANLYWQRVDGTGDVQRLTTSPRSQVPGSWHPDGDILAFVENDGDPRMSAIMLLRVEGDEASGWRPAEPRAILQGADQPMFSPDGRWLAYTTRAPGRQTPDVFVQAFPGPGGPWQVSSDGGTDPVWSATRPELLYASPDHRIVAVPYSVNGNSFRADKPRALSNTRFSPLVIGRQFDIHPDGNRFAVARDVAGASRDRTHLTLIFNAFGELRRAAPRSD
jgi:Tol biopolymer transport system component